MFKQILATQWRWVGWWSVGLALVAFSLPVASVQSFALQPESRFEIGSLLGTMQGWGYLYPALAVLSALLIALASWSPDHQQRHVYALSLPVPRWHYVLLRYGAGAVLLLPVVAGVWIGALVASASISLPPGLHAYPSSVAWRFALTLLLFFSLIFALASGTKRTAGYLIGAWFGLFVLQGILTAAGTEVDLIGDTLQTLLTWPGPLVILATAWMLIDV